MTTQADPFIAAARTFLRNLDKARRRARIYPPEHPYVRESQELLAGALDELILVRDSVTLSISEGDVFIEGRHIPDDDGMMEHMISDLARRDLVSITFLPGISGDELMAFIVLSVAKPPDLEALGGIKAALERKRVRRVLIGRKSLALSTEEQPEQQAETTRVSRGVYRTAVQAVIQAFAEASGRETISLELVDGVARMLVSGVLQHPDTFLGLSAMKDFHEYTFYHSVNVAILSMLMGSKLHFHESLLHTVGVAALLHDLGKVQMPLEILDKPGKLTQDEFEYMKSHAPEGARILTEQGANPLAVVTAAQHHVHFDHHGYPDYDVPGGLHFISHLVTIVDVYDALTSDRSYRTSMLPDRAMQIIIEGRGTTFHPTLTKVFASLTGMFPVGTLVELDTGELAVVCKPNPGDIYRPQAKVLAEPCGESRAFRAVDLAERDADGAYLRSIVRSIDPRESEINVADYL
ncbi:MAG TPA: HD domain-containing protein [Candidatus Hydrogenedentes bacterium]|nr:HD domain-containing protein [Candidatus Hydrogenedentota bacterium]HQE81669.1 HD domain-containing protein [Candidatus Hydrogenedentota bacterium]HQH51606.1 HD domain-containing protein [Candidatus Hydrogenedentota bacterium]HQM49853.1 HD domain-containing protein [Candidatus Hydrogenedentota bacterium]